MAYHTYRYRFAGVTAQYIDEHIDPTFPVTLVDSGPRIQQDISADDSTKTDLDDIMARRGWVFVQADPLSPTPQTTRQVVSTFLAADTSTASTAFSTLLTVNIQTETGFLEILATAASNAVTQPGFMRLVVDGVAVPQSGAGHLIGVAGHAINRRVAIIPGLHTVELQWRTAAGGTLQIQPATNPDREHAALLVRETF